MLFCTYELTGEISRDVLNSKLYTFKLDILIHCRGTTNTAKNNVILMKLNTVDIFTAPQILSQVSLLSYYCEDPISYVLYLL